MFTKSNKLSTLKLMAILCIVFSCGDDEVVLTLPPSADFTFTIDETDKGKVTFTNASQRATGVSWDFGDGSAAVTETNPVHTYTESGTYEVTLTATGGGKTADQVKEVTINLTVEEPEGVLTATRLKKSWKLSSTAKPMKVGPNKDDGSWWSLNAATDRACLANDLFIFGDEGVFEYDSKGDVFGENYMMVGAENENICIEESLLDGDQAAWKSGVHEYTFTPAAGSTPAKITVTGTGAFLVLPKAYNGGEYNATDNLGPVADKSVTYEVSSYEVVDGVEQMKLSLGIAGGFWTFVLEPAE